VLEQAHRMRNPFWAAEGGDAHPRWRRMPAEGGHCGGHGGAADARDGARAVLDNAEVEPEVGRGDPSTVGCLATDEEDGG
jgi:hypothetical protein